MTQRTEVPRQIIVDVCFVELLLPSPKTDGEIEKHNIAEITRRHG
jgi:hypothetical protein